MPNSDVTLARIASTIRACSLCAHLRLADFGDDTQLFGVVTGNRERDRHPDGGIRASNVGLDVLRIDVAAVDDDQVLDATRDEQLTGSDETEITRAQVLDPARR